MTDELFMQEAVREAETAAAEGEVPVGAVIVHDGRVIARGRNLRETWQDPTAHAEVVAVRAAAQALGSWRLEGCTLYVTMEPCPMCAGVLVNARVDRLVYGCADPKAGAVDTLYRVCNDARLNHRVDVTAGVLDGTCGDLLRSFFRSIRRGDRVAEGT
ncbi:MAG TPA: tRNA adenosine(34) deaminase TadA [Myxococcota bacterium]|nr:tRNA adenosine(34) deaminase TadA [Myxococcota bacterium]